MDHNENENVQCPVCARHFPQSTVETHVNECLKNSGIGDDDDFELETSFEIPSSSENAKLEQFIYGDTVNETGSYNLQSSSSSCSSFAVNQEKVQDIVDSESRKNPWSFLKCPQQTTGQTKGGQKGKIPLQKGLTEVIQNPTDKSRKHPAHSDSEHYDSTKAASGTNAKRPKLQSSSTESIPLNSGPAVKSEVPARMQMVTSGFAAHSKNHLPSGNVTPLAEKMRPASFDDFEGQEEVVGQSKMLRKLIDSENFPSMILWGPPGSGKTTLARIVAQRCRKLSSWRFAQLSATMSGISDIKESIQIAKNEKLSFKRKTILFIDEIHRFNKLQQDSFLPHVEDGTIVLIGATTENPSFHINNALLSRCKVFVLEKLSVQNIANILQRSLKELNVGLLSHDRKEINNFDSTGYSFKTFVEPEVIDMISNTCDGDARYALNCLQNLLDAKSSVCSSGSTVITGKDATESLSRSHIQYDRLGDEHYNCVSALIKSIRGSSDNGAIYWLARMLEGGEDPLFIARRLVILASEDIGVADVHALPLAVSTHQACHFIGMPECALNLAHCVTYLARAPKSNEAYAALSRARTNIREHHGPLPGVPLHLRNAPTKLMQDLGYHKGYQYNHDIKGPVYQEYLPKELLTTNFFDSAHDHLH